MAGTGGDWNSFMQSREGRTMLYSICTLFCGYHAINAVIDLLHPESYAILIENMGETGFYAMTAVRFAVCIWAAIMFARQAYKAFKEK